MKILIIVLLTLVLVMPGQAWGGLGASVVQSNDSWRSVETNNLFVIGNTDPESLRQVATWLEFFHSAFGRLVSRSVVNSSVPTRVVVFRDEASFLPFKPLYQGKPLELAGYFQPGEDLNYIAILLDRSGRERNPYSTAFHEYVHLHVRENISTAPLWLNEGLAEFYSSLQFSGNDAVIGAPINAYLRLLRTGDMLPLDTLFSISHSSPHYNERDKSGIFYGQSWALVHYLMMGGGGQRQEQFKQFLQLISRGDRADKAIENAFGMTLSTVEKGLQDYVQRGEFSGQRITIGDSSQAYASYTAMQRMSLTDAEATYYLGDLLLHINREDAAERYFEKAIAFNPNLPLANAALGLLRVEQRRYPEAKKYLQRAVATPQNYRIHYLYAYILSREGLNSTGENPGYSREIVGIMREQLLRTVKLAPNFAAAYHLLALVDLVSDEHLDEAELMATKAQQLAPTKRDYSILLAQIYLRRSNSEGARGVLEPLARHSDASVRAEAQQLLDSLDNVAGTDRARKKIQLNPESMAEPEVRSTSRGMVGGSTPSGPSRDGSSIDSSGPMPTLDELLARYVQAIGGEKAINTVSNRVSKGTLDEVGVSRNGSFEIHSQAPNKSFMVMDAYQMGTVKMGFNGRSGWVQSASGFRNLKGADLAALARDSDFYGKVRLKAVFAKVSLLGKSKIGYRDVYVLELQPLSGPSEKLFLSAETYLPIRLNTHRNVGSQLAAVELYFDDWQEIDGIKLPFYISQRSSGRTLAFRITEVRHNVTLIQTLFDPPVK